MKTYSSKTIEDNNTIQTVLDEIRTQGDSHIPNGAFKTIIAVFVVSLIGIVSILSNVGMEFIDDHFGTVDFLIAFVLLSTVIALASKWFIQVWLMLWKMTKED